MHEQSDGRSKVWTSSPILMNIVVFHRGTEDNRETGTQPWVSITQVREKLSAIHHLNSRNYSADNQLQRQWVINGTLHLSTSTSSNFMYFLLCIKDVIALCFFMSSFHKDNRYLTRTILLQRHTCQMNHMDRSELFIWKYQVFIKIDILREEEPNKTYGDCSEHFCPTHLFHSFGYPIILPFEYLSHVVLSHDMRQSLFGGIKHQHFQLYRKKYSTKDYEYTSILLSTNQR